MHSAFNQFAAFQQDVIDNRQFLAKGKLTMPVLAIGGDKSFGPAMAAEMRVVASDVTEMIFRDAGHWLMEEQPAATIDAIRAFLEKR
jgi:pimeloyl-ACP methyl ester carboxylesterase